MGAIDHFGVAMLASICVVFIIVWRARVKKDLERKKLIELYGPATINYYAHVHCGKQLRELVAKRKDKLVLAKTKSWLPSDLIGKFSDIHSCDVCNEQFLSTDQGCLSFCYMSSDEYRIYKQIESTKPS